VPQNLHCDARVHIYLDKQRGARSSCGMHGRYGDIHLPCLHLKPAVEVSRIQREPVASAEYKVILMPGYACIRPPALNHQPMLRDACTQGSGNGSTASEETVFLGRRTSRPSSTTPPNSRPEWVPKRRLALVERPDEVPGTSLWPPPESCRSHTFAAFALCSS
jgi:hypothetical protein